MKYLLTLLLLFLAPHDTTLDPVIDDEGRIECAENWGWEDVEPHYYMWEDCLFGYSGTYDDDTNLSRNDHQALMELVWSDYMGDADPPTLRRGKSAVEAVCEPYDDSTYPDGCYTFEWTECGPWRVCKEVDSIAVRSTSRRLLLHEVAHAIYDTIIWHPFWGFLANGAYEGTYGHDIGFRCFLLDIYAWYDYDYNAATDTSTYHVAQEPYDLLRNVCVANGWSD